MLKLIIPNISHKEQWEEIMAEWGNSKRKPAIFFQESYDILLSRFYELSLSDDSIKEIPKSSFYFLVNTENMMLL